MRVKREISGEAFSGERFIFSEQETDLELEHLHRYIIAADVCYGKSVLDAACGDGFGSMLLSQVAESVVGIDIDHRAIEQAEKMHKNDNLRYLAQPITEMTLETRSFDVIVSFETIEHVRDQEKVLAEFARLLKPDGVLILSSPDRENYNLSREGPNPYHVKEMSRDELSTLVGHYFSGYRFYYQANLYGSAVFSAEAAPTAVSLIRRMASTGTLEYKSFERAALYHILVCGNGDLPALKSGIYTGGIHQNAMSSLLGGIKERDDVAAELRHDLTEALREKAAFAAGCDERDAIIAELRHGLIGALREKAAFAAGCDERDAIIAELRHDLTGALREKAAFAGGCDERDTIIAELRHDLAEALREKAAFAGGCDERDAIIQSLRRQSPGAMR